MFNEIIDKVKDKMERNLTLDRDTNYNSDDQMLVNLFLGLVLESSEVANEFHKCKTVDEYKKSRNLAHTEEEMGDVFFYWLALSIKLGLDPNKIVKRNIDKMDERYLKMLEKIKG
jgi:NTP pyrophosphatase (non-canonical NTP hydrolase)